MVNISIPRWIVEERPDATNVNNWHWTEKNADAWSKAKIKVEELLCTNLFKHDCLAQELFENHVIEVPSVGNVILEEVEKIEGEARANNRKGKLIFFYEWEIAVKWKGHANGKDTEVPHHCHWHVSKYLTYTYIITTFISGDWKD